MRARATKLLYTVDDLAQIPDDRNRYEIIDGELLITRPQRPWHQLALVALVVRLGKYTDSLGVKVLIAPADVRVSQTTQVQPDLFVLRSWVKIVYDTRFVMMDGLFLAIEVLGRSTVTIDRGKKRLLYLAQGIDQYWMVDVDRQTVEVCLLGSEASRTESAALRWQPFADREALVIDLVEMFAEVREWG